MTPNFHNIPDELKQFNQWLLWKHAITENGRPTKVPYAHTGKKARVNDPLDCCSFEHALSIVHQYDGIGFLLTKNDPYTILDLDNKPYAPCTPEQLARHTKIFESFQSYTERSVSGTGIHIVVRGSIPTGVSRDNIDAASSERYMIFTGDVIRNAPILDYQPLLNVLYGEMKPPETTELEQVDGIMDDTEVIAMAMRASNADKFNSLCMGEMSEYPSQSEADFALLSIIAYYTRDNEQVRRLFRMSALGKRDKANRDKYLNDALEKIRAKQPAPVDMDAMARNADAMVANMRAKPTQSAPAIPHNAPPPVTAPTSPTREHPRQQSSVIFPPGLIGDLARYFFSAAIRPVPEVALAAALAITAGVCGRSYNISGTGLNQYIVLLARTGSGKEGAAEGIENLIAAVRPQLPMVDQFIGPAAFASGQALVKVLNEKQCFVSILGEFGLTLQQLSDKNANGPQIMLRKVLLDLYTKSGWNRVLRSSVYSDTEKNTASVQAPNVTILGESTQENFFDGLDATHVSEGLIPRFLIIEYTGPRPPRNLNAHGKPAADLIQRFSDLVASSITKTNSSAISQVAVDDHSLKLLDAFDTRADAIMNDSKIDAEAQVWNRAHLKALKLAALIAVGVNPHAPTVTADVAKWAIDFVSHDCTLMTGRFKEGDVGAGDSKQFNDLKRVIEGFFHLTPENMKGYEVSTKMFKDKVIPYRYLMRRTANVSAFRNDKLGATQALKKSLQSFLDSGMLVELPKPKLAEKYEFSGQAFGIGKHWHV